MSRASIQTTNLRPDYLTFSELLLRVGSDFSAAQTHGYLCGFLCTGSGGLHEAVANVLGKPNDDVDAFTQMRKLIATLCEESLRQLIDMEFAFQLLLPDDDEPLEARSRALGDWCFGFVTALESASAVNENSSSVDVLEVLQNFQEIAEIDYDNVDISEEDEVAYTEVVEYARMGVILVFTQLHSSKTSTDGGSTLH